MSPALTGKKKKGFFFFFKQAGSGQNFCSDILLVTFHFLPQRHPLRIAPECSFWCIFSGFPDSSVGKESACNAGDLGSIAGLGRSPGGRHSDPLQYPCLENPHGQRSPVGYRPWVLQRIGQS